MEFEIVYDGTNTGEIADLVGGSSFQMVEEGPELFIPPRWFKICKGDRIINEEGLIRLERPPMVFQ